MAGGWECACGTTNASGPRCSFCGQPAPWYEPPPAKVVESPRRGGWLRRLQVVAVAVLVAVSVNWVTTRDARQDVRERAERIAAYEAAIADLHAFVARERGRPFTKPVPVSLLGPREFEIVALGVLDRTEPRRSVGEQGLGVTLRTLGIETRDVPADDTSGVQGVYDEETREVYVRGDTLTPYVRSVVVHELTHAWQDQHLGLAQLREARGAGADAALAADALVEGDAERVRQAWLATQPAADQEAVARGRAEGTPVTRLLWAWDGFPYLNGPDFVRALARRGGNAAVDRAFARPPTTTEQVLHVDAYVRAERAARVERPRSFGSEEDRGTFGEAGLAVIVARGQPDAEARAAVSGWAGDAYVTWHDGPAVCTDMVVRMDSRAARDRLIRALRTRTQPGDDVMGHGTHELRARFCA